MVESCIAAAKKSQLEAVHVDQGRRPGKMSLLRRTTTLGRYYLTLHCK
jgi:hypothetical protein